MSSEEKERLERRLAELNTDLRTPVGEHNRSEAALIVAKLARIEANESLGSVERKLDGGSKVQGWTLAFTIVAALAACAGAYYAYVATLN